MLYKLEEEGLCMGKLAFCGSGDENKTTHQAFIQKIASNILIWIFNNNKFQSLKYCYYLN